MQTTESGNKMIRVLIADDHAILREGLKGLLEEYADISVVGEAVTGRDAVEKVREFDPDILLLDLIMPELGGVDALKMIVEEELGAKVIILTGADDDELLSKCIRGGAQGYILKDAASDHVVEAIRTVAGGNCWLPPGLTEKLIRGMSKPAQTKDEEKLAQLTPREVEVLRLLGEARSNSAIAEELFISEHTVKVHVSRILEKLGIETRSEAVRFAIRLGIAKA